MTSSVPHCACFHQRVCPFEEICGSYHQSVHQLHMGTSLFEAGWQLIDTFYMPHSG